MKRGEDKEGSREKLSEQFCSLTKSPLSDPEQQPPGELIRGLRTLGSTGMKHTHLGLNLLFKDNTGNGPHCISVEQDHVLNRSKRTATKEDICSLLPCQWHWGEKL